MEAMLIVWAIGVLPNLAGALIPIGLFGTLGSLFTFAFLWSESIEIKKRFAIPVVFGFIMMLIVGSIIPDRNTALAMGAAYIGQNIIESPKVQELASDSVDVLSSYLKKAKKDLEQENK